MEILLLWSLVLVPINLPAEPRTTEQAIKQLEQLMPMDLTDRVLVLLPKTTMKRKIK